MVDVLLVGGGTAGHVLPAIATAQTLMRLEPDIRLEFAGRARSLEERLVSAAGLPFNVVDAVALPRRVSSELVTVVPRLIAGVRSARRLLTESGARSLASFGGYVALPLTLAARNRIPLILHEQNSRPGLANRLAARSADHIAVTFPSSSEGLRSRVRINIVGNPVQERIRDLDVVARRPEALQRLGLSAERRTLLVLGGSQGARSINRAVTAAADAWRALNLQVVHLTGERGYEESVAWWHSAGVDPDDPDVGIRVHAFAHDMSDVYAVADLAVSRAGATTLAELSVLGIPSILVPYPHATAQHQDANAVALVAAGAAVLVDDGTLSPEVLSSVVAALVGYPAGLLAMGRAARAWSRPDAAEALALLILSALGTSDA